MPATLSVRISRKPARKALSASCSAISPRRASTSTNRRSVRRSSKRPSTRAGTSSRRRDSPMAMAADQIESLIREGIPDARVEIGDLAGEGDHYGARVVAESCRGLPRVKQHQRVYEALGGRMGTELHALKRTAATPD